MGRGVFTVGAVGAVGAVVIALSLSGCVEQPAPVESDAPEVSTEEYQVGEALTQEEAWDIANDPESPYGVYVAGDGSFILVTKDEPLPEAVVSEVRTEVVGQLAAWGDSAALAGPDIGSRVASIAATTGRPLVVVFSGVAGWDDPDRPESLQWFAKAGDFPALNQNESQRTREGAIAAADAYVAANGGEVIIVG